jgi:hypothetical protein
MQGERNKGQRDFKEKCIVYQLAKVNGAASQAPDLASGSNPSKRDTSMKRLPKRFLSRGLL